MLPVWMNIGAFLVCGLAAVVAYRKNDNKWIVLNSFVAGMNFTIIVDKLFT